MTGLVSLGEGGSVPEIGGKAATLARLLNLGERVPPGIVIPAGADPVTIGADVARWLAAAGHPDRVAVRSSAPDEDGAVRSMAGAYRTELDVLPDAAGVMEAVRRVRLSGPSVAALIQPMLSPSRAGVAFSADPLTGDSVVVIEAVEGLADRLMAGEETGRRYTESDGDEFFTRHQVDTVATTVRRIAEHLGCDVDVEWAWCDDGLWILQARPITALPIQPELDIPGGTWEKDVTHSPRPVSPLMASLLPRMDAVMADWTSQWGMMIAGLESRSFGGEVYNRALPPIGKPEATGPTPPWWLLAIVARALPPLRRRLRAAAQAERTGLAEEVVARWHTEWRGQLAVEIESWRQQELQPAAFLELVGMGHELLDLMDRAAMIHFELFVPYLLGVHRWVEDAKKLLGWDDARSIAALAGHSPASSEPTRLMTEVVRAIRETGGVESVRASANPLAAAAELGGEVAQALERWEAVVGFRLSDYDIAAPLVSEIPGLMSSLLRAALDASDVDATVGIDLDAAHLAPEDRSRLERSFAAATAVFPLREENVHLTSSMPGAALRRVIAEIGSRLAADGLIDRVDDVFYLTWDEIQRPPVDAANLVRRRLAEEAWTAAHPGPPFHGPPPGAPPDVRGLPGPARRINGALLWAMQHELAARPEVTGEAVRGTGCSAGVHVGRVRLVRTEADLSRLEPGDVMVCPIATTAWSVVFGMIGAIVCDGGGVLSHTAIVAREHGIPAVMGVGNGTTKLVDGEIVRVDGTRGTVEKV